MLNFTCCEADNQAHIVGLDLRLVSSLVSHRPAASITAVGDNISALGVGLSLDGTENSAAVVGSVTGVNIDVQGAQTEGAVVSRGIAERQNLFSAGAADKAAVVFSESLVFHISILWMSVYFLAFLR